MYRLFEWRSAKVTGQEFVEGTLVPRIEIKVHPIKGYDFDGNDLEVQRKNAASKLNISVEEVKTHEEWDAYDAEQEKLAAEEKAKADAEFDEDMVPVVDTEETVEVPSEDVSVEEVKEE